MNQNKNGVELSWKGKQVADVEDVLDNNISILEEEHYPHGEGAEQGALYWADNSETIKYLLANGWKGKVDMIYIDPPFFSGSDFSIKTTGGQRQRAYKDTWTNGLPQYLSFMNERLGLMYQLLKETGSIYVHLDWHVTHYIKVLLDEIFGYSNFRNQIIWKRLTYKQTQVKAYGVLHDVILYYTKGNDYTWNDVRAEYDEERLKKYFCWVETPDGKNIKLTRAQLNNAAQIPKGRRFALNPIINPNPNRPNLTYEFLGFTKVWKYTNEKMLGYYMRGIIFQPSENALPQKKQYLDESAGMKLNDIFLDVGGVMGGSNERVEFDTQKPLKLLKRLISVSSNPGDVVADFFCGSGTTLVASQELGRRWIGSEISWLGIHTTKKRLLANLALDEKLHEPEGFSIYNINSILSKNGENELESYVDLILKLYKADRALPLKIQGRIHGMKQGRAVHVHRSGRPLTIHQLLELASDIKATFNDGIDILSEIWAFPVDWNPSKIAKECKCDLRLVHIPSVHEIRAALVGIDGTMDPLANQADIDTASFFVEPDVTIELVVNGTKVTLDVRGIGLGNEPAGEKVDLMSVDWMYNGKVFAPALNVARTKDASNIPLSASFIYPEKGNFTICIHITDVHCHIARRFNEITIQ
nr:site-specific DNA-methyltransferase [Candidatus Sigynarchaeota archaeon]